MKKFRITITGIVSDAFADSAPFNSMKLSAENGEMASDMEMEDECWGVETTFSMEEA
jgi:hypothetical protein